MTSDPVTTLRSPSGSVEDTFFPKGSLKLKDFHRKSVRYNGDTITFQSLEWNDIDLESGGEAADEVESGSDPESENEEQGAKYLVRCFGVSDSGHSVCMNVTGFTPYFYVQVPDTYTDSHKDTFLENLSNVNGIYNGKVWHKCLSKYKNFLLKKRCCIVEKYDYYGFHSSEGNGGDPDRATSSPLDSDPIAKSDPCKKFKFIKLVFDNKSGMSRFKYAIKSHNKTFKEGPLEPRIKGVRFPLALYEDNLDPILRFIHVKDLTPCGWIKASNINVISSNSIKKSRCQIEFDCDWNDIQYIDSHSNSNFLQASFDIEVYSHDYLFPVPTIKENVVTQIATVFKKYNDNCISVVHLITLKTCNPIKEIPGLKADLIVVESYQTEREVLLAWAKLLRTMDPDILYTYNGDSFDCMYLYTRSIVNGIENEFLNFGKVKDQLCSLKKSTFTSSARGTTDFERLLIPGRINFDLFIFIKMTYTENSYKLDDIAEKYIGENKHEVSPREMFDWYASGDPNLIEKLGRYCIQDTVLLQKLVDQLYITQAQISMSNVTLVPFKFLIEKGQQIKIFSQILKETASLDFLVPSSPDSPYMEDYEGATVLKPDQGAYYEPVIIVDFEGLYPSIMTAHNLCHSTIILDKKDLIEGTYNTFTWFDATSQGDITYHYTKPEHFQGILPKILGRLKESRNEYKKKMKNAPTKDLKQIYNNNQLAYKVSMNSIYGFMAAQMLTCKPVAATVTAIGRKMIKNTREFLEKEYAHLGCKTIYGDTDSVFFICNTDLVKKYKKIAKIVLNTQAEGGPEGDPIFELERKKLEELKTQCIAEAIEIGKMAGEAATVALFKKPINLEFEKVYFPLILLSKKRYIGMLYSNNATKPDYQDSKGIILKRRDGTKILRDLYQGIIDIIINLFLVTESGNASIINKIKTVIHRIVSSDTKDILDDIIITKSYKGPSAYKNDNIPHVCLAKILTERDPGNAPRPSDRISYIFVDDKKLKKGAPQYTKVEDPKFAIENGLEIDKLYYINNLITPISELVSAFVPNIEEVINNEMKSFEDKRKTVIKKKMNLESLRAKSSFIEKLKRSNPEKVIKQKVKN